MVKLVLLYVGLLKVTELIYNIKWGLTVVWRFVKQRTKKWLVAAGVGPRIKEIVYVCTLKEIIFVRLWMLMGPKQRSRKNSLWRRECGNWRSIARKGYIREDILWFPVMALALDKNILSVEGAGYRSLCTGWLIWVHERKFSHSFFPLSKTISMDISHEIVLRF